MSTSDDSFPEYPTAAPREEPQTTPSEPAAVPETVAPAATPLPESLSTESPAAEPSPVPESPPVPDAAETDQTSVVEMESVAPTPTTPELEESNVDTPSTLPLEDPTNALHLNTASESPIDAHANNSMMKKISSTFEIRTAALRARLQKRETKLNRIMESAHNRGSITNNDIERLLHVSDTTATRYAKLLVQRGDLVQHGKGPNVRYSPKN